MNRWKNYGLWISIFAFLPMILGAFGYNIFPENYEEIVKAFLGILVLAGIISNPTDGTGYMDNQK